MFGGLCFTLNGKMLVGLAKDGRIVVRLSSSELGQALAAGRAEPMDFTGKPMKNFAYVSAQEFERPGELAAWIEQSARYVRENMLGTASTRRKAPSARP